MSSVIVKLLNNEQIRFPG